MLVNLTRHAHHHLTDLEGSDFWAAKDREFNQSATCTGRFSRLLCPLLQMCWQNLPLPNIELIEFPFLSLDLTSAKFHEYRNQFGSGLHYISPKMLPRELVYSFRLRSHLSLPD
jgi:hypothetical protein